MKKLLTLGVIALAMSATPALADHHGEGKKGGMSEKHDTNGDGTVTEAEFVAHATERAKEHFAKMDTDGNGEISKEEAAAGKEKMREKMKERRAKMKDRKGAPDAE